MDELIQILESINPDVDYRKETNLIDGKILDSFDIITIIKSKDKKIKYKPIEFDNE